MTWNTERFLLEKANLWSYQTLWFRENIYPAKDSCGYHLMLRTGGYETEYDFVKNLTLEEFIAGWYTGIRIWVPSRKKPKLRVKCLQLKIT